jgi:hypothetical protein
MDKKLPGMAAEDIGKCAYGIFQRGSELIGKRVGIAGEHLRGDEMASALTKALGKPVVYNAVSPETYRSFGFPGADDLGNMFQVKRDFEKEYCGARSIEFSRSLNPSLQSFRSGRSGTRGAIPLDCAPSRRVLSGAPGRGDSETCPRPQWGAPPGALGARRQQNHAIGARGGVEIRCPYQPAAFQTPGFEAAGPDCLVLASFFFNSSLSSARRRGARADRTSPGSARVDGRSTRPL